MASHGTDPVCARDLVRLLASDLQAQHGKRASLPKMRRHSCSVQKFPQLDALQLAHMNLVLTTPSTAHAAPEPEVVPQRFLVPRVVSRHGHAILRVIFVPPRLDA